MNVDVPVFLRFIRYKNLDRWDIKSLSSGDLSFKYPPQKLRTFLTKSKIEWVDIEDDKAYPILGVHAQGEGVYINKVAMGRELKMKHYQRSKVNTLFYCKVRTVKGQWGIVTPEFAGSFGSSNMQYLDIDFEKIDPEYFINLLKLKKLTDIWDKNAIGADGRHFTLKTMLGLQIPLPEMKTQKALISQYRSKIHQAELFENKAAQIQNDIETYILSNLGIYSKEGALNNKKTRYSFLRFVRYKGIERWDCYSDESEVFAELKKSPYSVSEIGKAYNFTKRNWNKKEKTFRYVEIGSVDSMNGIVKAEEISTSKAPSRATQIIKTGDLILGTTRPYLKKFAIVDSTYNNCICSSGFQVIASNKKNNSSFLCEYLKTSAAVKQFEHFMTGALYPAITNKDLMKILIPLPPIEIQNTIVEHISEQKTKIKQLKQQAETLRKAALIEFEKEIFE